MEECDAEVMRGSTDVICPRCFAQRSPTAAKCWRCGEPFGGASGAEGDRPPTGDSPSGTFRLLWLILVVLVVAVAAGTVWAIRSTGFLPERADEFTLVRSRTVTGGLGLGPPVSHPDDLTMAEQRFGVYAHDEGLVAVSVAELDVSGFSTRDLLRAQLLDRFHGPWSTTKIQGVSYTCGGGEASRWCFWGTSTHLGHVGTMGYPARTETSIAALRRLSVALHDAVS
jgi:ribosomal protein L40E